MIVTLTANPSLDRTVALPGALQRGRVQRATSVHSDPGGKGVNVARVVTAAGRVAVAVLPGSHDDPLVLALREVGVTHRAVPVAGRVRVNLTLTEPDGTTTKVNDPGLALDREVLDALAEAVLREAAGARWAVLSGSLPPGVPDDWYAELVAALQGSGAAVAVDTSGAPLNALLAPGVTFLPDLLKPNGEELAELVGTPDRDLESDPAAAAEAAATLVERGVGAVLATLGAAGAVLVTPEGSWSATPPPVQARSTVGAGDSALAGYVLADLRGAGPAERLASAVAHGAAAASLPGSTLPRPADVSTAEVVVTRLPVPTPVDPLAVDPAPAR
jgi:1-phosphofructokinase